MLKIFDIRIGSFVFLCGLAINNPVEAKELQTDKSPKDSLSKRNIPMDTLASPEGRVWERPAYYWGDFGMGLSNSYGGLLSGHLGLNVVNDGLWYSLDFTTNGDSLNCFGLCSSSSLSFNDAGFVFGMTKASYRTIFLGGCGVAYVWGMDRGALKSPPDAFIQDFERDKINTVGLIAEAQAKLMLHYFAIGVALSGDLNPHRSFASFQFILSVGRFQKFDEDKYYQ